MQGDDCFAICCLMCVASACNDCERQREADRMERLERHVAFLENERRAMVYAPQVAAAQ